MPQLDRVTPLILTLDEEPNIGRVLERLRWASRIVVVDSHSQDATTDIVRAWPGADLLQRRFDTPAEQWNYGLEHVATEWVLSLDADYVVPDGLVEEIAALPDESAVNSYFAAFEYVVAGRRLRASLYPPRAVLFRRDGAKYVNDGHTQLLAAAGPSGTLKTKILHDDRKPLRRWLASQLVYAENEADKLLAGESANLNLPDRLRRTAVLGPLAIAFYCLVLKGLWLDGWRGWWYTLERMAAETILAMRLIERRFFDRLDP